MLQSPKAIPGFLSYFGRFEFLLIQQLLILQVLHFVLENPQLSDQALKTECVPSLSRFEPSARCFERVCIFFLFAHRNKSTHHNAQNEVSRISGDSAVPQDRGNERAVIFFLSFFF